jgi:hypothetical protein
VKLERHGVVAERVAGQPCAGPGDHPQGTVGGLSHAANPTHIRRSAHGIWGIPVQGAPWVGPGNVTLHEFR